MSMPPVSSSGVVVNTPVFLGLGLTVTESKIKKVQKQDLKNIKNVGIACQGEGVVGQAM